MLQLREMTQDDLPLFRAWLSLPHVAKWYAQPLDWIAEVAQQDDAFSWIHHYIAADGDTAVGFCQYYACADSEESWGGYTARGGAYSLDYLIGEPAYLRRGYGKQIVAALLEKIAAHSDAQRVVVQPEPENTASRRLLLSCGFALDTATDIFVREL